MKIKPKISKPGILGILFLGISLGFPFLSSAVDIYGYFENRAFVIENPDESWKDLGEKLRLGDYNRLRLHYTMSPSKIVTVNAAVDYYSYHGLVDTMLWNYIGPPSPTSSNVRIDMDRIYIDLHFKKMDISIGKQRIPLGVSYVWAPLDVFSRVNVFEPKEEKAGVNGFKIYMPLGSSSSITGIFSPDLKVGSSSSALRAQTQVAGIDAAVTLIHQGGKETSIYGIDLRGEHFIGWWVETAYQVSREEDNQSRQVMRQKDVKLVLGFDYTFPLNRGLYWVNEFFYDSTGEKNREEYDFRPLFTGERYTLGKWYLFSLLRYNFDDFFTASFSYIANWGDGSFLLNPMVQYEISSNILVSAGFYLPLGCKDGEYRKYKQKTFYVWFKINF